MTDKVVGGEHHLADIAVKTRFVPVLTTTKKKQNDSTLSFLKAAGLMIFKKGQRLINEIHFKEA